MKISIETWKAERIATPIALKKSVDFWGAAGWKNPDTMEFHSYAEYLAAGVLELSPQVKNYVPQPFRFRVGSQFYIPDFWVFDKSHSVEVWELKPNAELGTPWEDEIKEFCAKNQVSFIVKANEEFTGQEQAALNSWRIIDFRKQYSDIPVQKIDEEIMIQLLSKEKLTLQDLSLKSNKQETNYLIGIVDAIIAGELGIDLHNPLTFETKVWLR